MHPVIFLFEEINRDWGMPERRHMREDRKQGFRWRGRRTRSAPERN